jgi:hypothetical protein
MKTSHGVTALLLTMTLAVLTACTPTTPTPSDATASPKPTASVEASATPTPTPAAAVAATVVISAASLRVLDASGATIVDLPFTGNGDAAATALAQALAATPVATPVAAGNCARPGTSYDFGGLIVDGGGTITMAPPAVFSVRATTATTAGGVAIAGPGGVQAGQSLADVVAAIPSADDLDATLLALENTGGSGPDVTGVLGYVNGGVLSVIASPVYIFGDC